MNNDVSSLLLALGIFSLGFISIGPNILAIIGTSMERGRDEGIRLALGVGTGSSIWAIVTVAGLTALITAYAEVIVVLKFAGVAYLAWLAYKAFRSAATVSGSMKPKAASGKNLYLQGLLVQLTNPKAALQWVAIVSLGLGPNAPMWVGITLVVVTTSLSILVHVLYAITFSTTPVVAVYQRARRWIEGALGVFFAFAAYKIATYKP